MVWEFLQLLFASKSPSLHPDKLALLPDTFLSYEALEDNFSFNVGDTITEIELTSEDWWQGMNPHGDIGLFPGKSCVLFVVSLEWKLMHMDILLFLIANYVEVEPKSDIGALLYKLSFLRRVFFTSE